MATALPANERDLMEALVTERWNMLTMDTEVDRFAGDASSIAGESWDILTDQLAYCASRLAGDGFEGEPDWRGVVDDLLETIGERLCAFAVEHRLRMAGPSEKGAAA